MSPRPPEFYESDSSWDEDEFVFSHDIDENGEVNRNRSTMNYIKPDNSIDKLQNAITSGNVDVFRDLWEADSNNHDINKALFQNETLTPLMLACQERHVDLVKYLLFDLHADPNANSNDMTALILACIERFEFYSDRNEVSAEEENKTLQICQLLLAKHAMIDKTNLRRETALMHAASNGYVSVIQLLLQSKATLEACDNDGKTALFYAVCANRFDATKALLEAGAMVDVEDRFNNSPKRLAQDRGHDAIVELFPPDPVVKYVAINFSSYLTYKDLIPTAFPEKEAPPYSPDVFTMLYGMRADKVEYNFYESCIGLPEFLSISDQRLRDIGIVFPYQRKRILLGLLKFHEKSWSKRALCLPKIQGNIQQYFDVLSNCLKQLITIRAAIIFIEKHDIFVNNDESKDDSTDDASQNLRQEINQELVNLRRNALHLLREMQMVEKKFAVPPPLHVCQNMVHDLLSKRTFRQQIYRQCKVLGCIGLGIVAAAVIRARIR